MGLDNYLNLHVEKKAEEDYPHWYDSDHQNWVLILIMIWDADLTRIAESA